MPDQYDTQRHDPVVQDELGWWFWNEAWTDLHGPYVTREAAEAGLIRYCRFIETGIDDE